VHSFILECDSNGAKAWIVDPEYLNCRAAYLCFPNQVRTVPFKMVAPRVPSGMKELDDFAGFRVPSRDVGAFALVAVHARQSRIFQAGFTAVLASCDVVDVVGRNVRGCGHVPIFAAPLCAIPDAADQALVHKLPESREHSMPTLRRATRARECITDKTFAMLT